MKAPEFAKALFTQSLPTPQIELRGKAKKDKTEDSILYQSWASSQGNWESIPAEMIEEINDLGPASCCEDCEHVSVTIKLKKAKTEEGKLLEKLFHSTNVLFNMANPPQPTAPHHGFPCSLCANHFSYALSLCQTLPSHSRDACIQRAYRQWDRCLSHCEYGI